MHPLDRLMAALIILTLAGSLVMAVITWARQ